MKYLKYYKLFELHKDTHESSFMKSIHKGNLNKYPNIKNSYNPFKDYCLSSNSKVTYVIIENNKEKFFELFEIDKMDEEIFRLNENNIIYSIYIKCSNSKSRVIKSETDPIQINTQEYLSECPIIVMSGDELEQDNDEFFGATDIDDINMYIASIGNSTRYTIAFEYINGSDVDMFYIE